MAGGPLADPSGAGTGDDISHHHVAVETQRLECHATDFRDAGEVFFHVGNIDCLGYREDDEVRGIGDLRLVPGMRAELGAKVGIFDDEKLPGLEAVGGGRENQGVLESRPEGGWDFF